MKRKLVNPYIDSPPTTPSSASSTIEQDLSTVLRSASTDVQKLQSVVKILSNGQKHKADI